MRATQCVAPGKVQFVEALDLIARREIDVRPMLTHRLRFDQLVQGYELVRTRDDGAVKVVIEMPGYRRCFHLIEGVSQ